VGTDLLGRLAGSYFWTMFSTSITPKGAWNVGEYQWRLVAEVNLACVSAVQPTFCKGDRGSSFFLLPPQEIYSSTGVFIPRFAPRGHISPRPRNKIVYPVRHVIKVIGEQMPVLIERHSRRFMA
jgi:hypothetical protein